MKRILLTVVLLVCLAAAFLAPRIALTARADAIRESVSTAQPLTVQDSAGSAIKRLMLLSRTNTREVGLGEMGMDRTELVSAFQEELQTLYELGAITQTMLACFNNDETLEGTVYGNILVDLDTGESAQILTIYTIYGDCAIYDQVCGKILSLYWTHDSEPMLWETKQLMDVSEEENYRLQLSAWAEYFSLETGEYQYINVDAALDPASGESVCIAAGTLTDGKNSVGMMLQSRDYIDGLAWSPVTAETVENMAESAEAVDAGLE